MEWFILPLQPFTRWMTTFTCSRWGYGATIICCYCHTPGRPDLVIRLKSRITTGCQMIPMCSGWGSKATWNGSHLVHSKHISIDWQASHVVDGVVEPPSCCYHHTCGTEFGKSSQIKDHCWVPNEMIILWLSISNTHGMVPTSLSNILDVIDTFTCCGWGYEATIMLLPPHLWDQIWK
jgi:hypothetical protein